MDRALAQKTALLHEVDHRVKNNLQLIASLLLLQSRRTEHAVAREALLAMLERVNAIAIVHRRLFQGEDTERFDVAQFVRDLVTDLEVASGRPEIAFRLDLERVDVAAAQAAPAALIVNELVSNAMKHAFPPAVRGSVEVRVRCCDGGFEIAVADDGVGFSEPEESVRGFGLTIAHLLCRQLSATLKFESRQPGVLAVVTLPNSNRLAA